MNTKIKLLFEKGINIIQPFIQEAKTNAGITFSVIIVVSASFLLSVFVDQYADKNSIKASLFLEESGANNKAGEWFARSMGGKDIEELFRHLPLSAHPFIREVNNLETVDSLRYYDLPHGIFFSFLGGKNDRMYPYFGTWTKDGDFTWNEITTGSIEEQEQKNDIIGVILKNTGVYPWDTTSSNWETSPQKEKIFFAEETLVLPQEQVKVFFKNNVPDFIINQEHGFTIAIEK